jgi:uncharacterized membrane protein
MKEIFNIPKQLRILIFLIMLLILIRVAYTGSYYYLFLLWNIFLAFIPFLISGIIVRHVLGNRGNLSMWIVFGGGILWLLTFPNAPYLVTDVIHLGSSKLIPKWYDVILLFVTALVGMLFTFYSLAHIEKALSTKYEKMKTGILLGLMIFVSSFGIYVGRFLRWNSWDVFTNPQELALDIWGVFVHPTMYKEAYAFTFTMLVFIGLSYYAWKAGNKEEK